MKTNKILRQRPWPLPPGAEDSALLEKGRFSGLSAGGGREAVSQAVRPVAHRKTRENGVGEAQEGKFHPVTRELERYLKLVSEHIEGGRPPQGARMLVFSPHSISSEEAGDLLFLRLKQSISILNAVQRFRPHHRDFLLRWIEEHRIKFPRAQHQPFNILLDLLETIPEA